MFTGIIEEKGRIISSDIYLSGRISVKAGLVLAGTGIGDSIAVNGVCLTVVQILRDGFVADVMPETAGRSNLGSLQPGDEVNLERAMASDGRFGGHIVSGHIDGTGTVESMSTDGNAVRVSVRTSPEILKLIVEKGSIAIDGISLTVVYVDGERFKVSLIPHTGSETTLLARKAGDVVNLENDIIGKYVQKMFGAAPESHDDVSGGITMEFLEQYGI